VDTRRIQLLYDPQTSGGLLAALAPESVEAAMAGLAKRGITGYVVGSVEPAAPASVVAVKLRGVV
jgi:selenide,water dikinase